MRKAWFPLRRWVIWCCVWGDKDTETPLWMGQRMEKDIPDSALIVLEGGTHFAYLEQIGRFNAIARSFLVETN